jgi:hypothetical protein
MDLVGAMERSSPWACPLDPRDWREASTFTPRQVSVRAGKRQGRGCNGGLRPCDRVQPQPGWGRAPLDAAARGCSPEAASKWPAAPGQSAGAFRLKCAGRISARAVAALVMLSPTSARGVKPCGPWLASPPDALEEAIHQAILRRCGGAGDYSVVDGCGNPKWWRGLPFPARQWQVEKAVAPAGNLARITGMAHHTRHS